jgi:uncharacterized membrane protein YeaQ/YmgE (transglycosylase-associated protein family)
MAWIWAIIVGFFVGLIARFLMPGKDPKGFFVTALIGIMGSVLAYWIGRAMGFYVYGEPVGFLASVIGAMLFLGVVRLIRGK